MIYTITLNPALDKTIEIPNFSLNKVNRIHDMRIDVGGKGINVSKVIKVLGGKSKAFGIVGGNNGKIIEDYLDHMNILHEFIRVDNDTRINLKIVDNVNNTTTEINESGGPYRLSSYDGVKQKIIDQVGRDDIVVISGSLPKDADSSIYSTIITICNKKGAKTYLDVDGVLLNSLIQFRPYLVKPNQHELESLYGKEFNSIDEYIQAGIELLKTGVTKVVISLGGNGALYITNSKIIYSKGISVEAINTVGAGDSLVAALAFAEDRNLSLEENVVLSIATSASSVMTKGTEPPNIDIIQELKKKVTYESMDYKE